MIADRFEVISELGREAGRATYRATDEQTGIPVVLKEFEVVGDDRAAVKERFEKTTALLRTLDHPVIPKYVAALCVEENDALLLFVAQEFVDGPTLEDLLGDGKSWSEEEAIRDARHVLEALDYLHGLKPPVVHGDICSSNLIRRVDGSTALIEFGDAQNIGAPGTTDEDPSADLRATGDTVAHILTGTPASELRGDDGELDLPVDLDISATARQLLEKLTAADEGERYTCAADALADLSAPTESAAETERQQPPIKPLEATAPLAPPDDPQANSTQATAPLDAPEPVGASNETAPLAAPKPVPTTSDTAPVAAPKPVPTTSDTAPVAAPKPVPGLNETAPVAAPKPVPAAPHAPAAPAAKPRQAGGLHEAPPAKYFQRTKDFPGWATVEPQNHGEFLIEFEMRDVDERRMEISIFDTMDKLELRTFINREKRSGARKKKLGGVLLLGVVLSGVVFLLYKPLLPLAIIATIGGFAALMLKSDEAEEGPAVEMTITPDDLTVVRADEFRLRASPRDARWEVVNETDLQLETDRKVPVLRLSREARMQALWFHRYVEARCQEIGSRRRFRGGAAKQPAKTSPPPAQVRDDVTAPVSLEKIPAPKPAPMPKPAEKKLTIGMPGIEPSEVEDVATEQVDLAKLAPKAANNRAVKQSEVSDVETEQVSLEHVTPVESGAPISEVEDVATEQVDVDHLRGVVRSDAQSPDTEPTRLSTLSAAEDESDS